VSETPPSNDPIAFFTDQYAQAVQALETIRAQSQTLSFGGMTDELRQFLDRFIELASSTAADAHLKGQEQHAGWFLKLVTDAERLRADMTGTPPATT
jgi:hypothetical protein